MYDGEDTRGEKLVQSKARCAEMSRFSPAL